MEYGRRWQVGIITTLLSSPLFVNNILIIVSYILYPWRGAIANINNDASKEIVLTKNGETGAYNGHIVALDSNGNQIWNLSSAPLTDFWDDPAIANVRNDLAGSEIIVSTQNYDYIDGRVYMLNGLWKPKMELYRWSANIFPFY